MPNLPIHTKYRPRNLDELIGHDAVVDSLAALLFNEKGPAAQAYLFTGPTGVGKTTLARIVMAHHQCELTEVDAASNSGIDDMRALVVSLRYPGLASMNRGLIVDEAHGLSRQSFDSLLKVIEEPPPHLFIALCTSMPSKVPETIVSRCQTYHLKLLRRADVMKLLSKVADAEEMTCSDDVLDLVADAAAGSARRALVMLASVAHCTNTKDAAELLESTEKQAGVIDLARLLVSDRLKWSEVVTILQEIDMPAESIRITLVNYIAAVVLKSGKLDNVLMDKLGYLSAPFNPTDKMAPLLVALRRCIQVPR